MWWHVGNPGEAVVSMARSLGWAVAEQLTPAMASGVLYKQMSERPTKDMRPEIISGGLPSRDARNLNGYCKLAAMNATSAERAPAATALLSG